MASLIQELITTLSEQVELYEKILKIASEKKVVIIENNIKALQEIIAKENTIVGKALRLDKKRIELFEDMKLVLNKKELTLSDIIETFKGQKEETILLEIKNKISNVLPKVKIINEQNQELIKMSMDYIDYSINLIRGGAIGKPTYYDSIGNEIDIADKKMFDAKQ